MKDLDLIFDLSECLSFPLFSKGKEKFQFQYGVFILNKNTAEVASCMVYLRCW